MPVRKTKNVSLSPEIEAFIDGRIAAGRYGNAGEVVRAALWFLEEDERKRQDSGPQAAADMYHSAQ
jgi:antitoxin ParD1/3/4